MSMIPATYSATEILFSAALAKIRETKAGRASLLQMGGLDHYNQHLRSVVCKYLFSKGLQASAILIPDIGDLNFNSFMCNVNNIEDNSLGIQFLESV